MFKLFSVVKMAGEDGTLTKENFTKILRSSDMFLKAFDKNKDGIVTEVVLDVVFEKTLKGKRSVYKIVCQNWVSKVPKQRFAGLTQSLLSIFYSKIILKLWGPR